MVGQIVGNVVSKARNHTSCETIGAGIDRALSRRIAQALDSDITVGADVAKGSTSTLWQPLVSRANQAA